MGCGAGSKSSNFDKFGFGHPTRSGADERRMFGRAMEQAWIAGSNEGWDYPGSGSPDSESNDGPKIESIVKKVSFLESFVWNSFVF